MALFVCSFMIVFDVVSLFLLLKLTLCGALYILLLRAISGRAALKEFKKRFQQASAAMLPVLQKEGKQPE